MPNQLLQRLQSQLNNQNPLNLINPESFKFEVSDEHDKSFENIFLLSSIALITLLASLTYINYNKSLEIKDLNESILLETNLTRIDKNELETRISKLSTIKNLKETITPIQDFFNFLKEVIKVENTQFLSINYKLLGKSIEFEIVLNTSNPVIEKELLEIITTNQFSTQLTKQSETTVEGTNLKQYFMKGSYEL